MIPKIAMTACSTKAGLLLAVVAAGCYQGSARSVSLTDVAKQPGWVLVDGMSIVRQDGAHDCGPAALAMVLARWGIADSAPEIRKAVAAPNNSGAAPGVSAGALRDVVRHKGLQAFLISGVQADLERELGVHRPVLVGLLQRYSGNRVYAHYEVVIGINPQRRRVLLMDPGSGPREDDLGAFESEWAGAGRLALVVAPS